MIEDSRLPFDLPAVKRKKVSAEIEAGVICSRCGLVFVARCEALLGSRRDADGCIRDWRDPAQVTISNGESQDANRERCRWRTC